MKRSIQWMLAGALCLGPSAFSQQMSVDFDPAATRITWSLVGNVHTSHGTFQLKEGHIRVDPANGNASGELIVEAETGESGNSARDKRMKKEILETDKYPEIRFKVKKLEGALSANAVSNLRILGQFSIHGASHEISIPLTVTIRGAEFSGSGKFVIPFIDWGMRNPSNFLFKVDKTVEVQVEAAGNVKR